jgi:hypothetical protein
MKLVRKKTTSKTKTVTPSPQRILFWNLTREDIEQLLLTGAIVLLAVAVVYMGRGIYHMATMPIPTK